MLDSSEVQDTPGHAVHHLFRDLGDLVRELPESIHGLLIEQVAELAADQQLKELLSDTVAANVDTWFSVVRHSIPFDRMESPTAALEHARRMAQREVPVNALLRAYRLGHQYGLNLIIAGLRSADLPPEEKLALIEHITRVSFRYIDWMSEQVLETYQTERAEWDERRRSLRAQAIRDILNGRDVDLTEASSAMRYFLGATHVALMVWLDRDAGADTDEFIAMERFMQHAVSATGAKQSVYFSIDRLVDHQPGTFQRCRPHRLARTRPCGCGPGGVTLERRPVDQACHPDGPAGAVQLPRHHPAVAAIVARAAQDQRRLHAEARGDRTRHGTPGILHQPWAGQALGDGRPVDLAHGVRRQQDPVGAQAPVPRSECPVAGLRRALDRHLQQPGIARLDFAA